MTSTPVRGALRRTPVAVLDRLTRHRHELLDRARYDEHRRWHVRLPPAEVGTDHVEVWLLSWLPGQESPLHDHGGSAGAFTVLFGALDETVVSRVSGGARDHLWAPGAVRRFPADHVHRVGNDGGTPAVSLHAYRPALTSMTRFDRIRDGLRVATTELAGRDW